jgi:1-acyl-sn-glycerol-3-phosphate acyltransferase
MRNAAKVNHYFHPDPCGPECVPEPRAAPRVGRLHYLIRRCAFAGTYVVAFVFGLLSLCCDEPTSRRLLRCWARLRVRATGARVVVEGTPATAKPALLVANHVSNLDAMVMWTVAPFTVVSVDQTRRHPALGRLSRGAGTIFHSQAALSTLPALISDTTEALRAGVDVLVFPEGKVRCAAPGGPFSPSSFQAAINARAVVRPVLIDYEVAGGASTARVARLGTEPISAEFHRIMRMRGLVFRVRVFADIDTAGRTRGQLAALAKEPLEIAAGGMPATCARVRNEREAG